MDLNIVCRGCLAETDVVDYFKLDEIGLNDQTYKQMLEEVSGFQILPEAEPNRLCENCGIVLLEMFKFKQTLNETQEILSQLTSEVTEDGVPMEMVDMPLDENEYGITVQQIDPGKTIEELMDAEDVEAFESFGLAYVKQENKIEIDYGESDGCTTVVEQNKISCPYCDVTCSTNQSLSRHMTNQHPDVIPDYACNYCDKVYHFKEWLDNHERQCPGARAAKEGMTEFSCKHCQKVFNSYRNMRSHVSLNHRDLEKQADELARGVSCPFCTAKLKNVQTLRHHLQNVHAEMRTIKCDYCDTLTFTSDLLQVHLNKCKGFLEKMESQQMVCPYCPVIKAGKKKLHAHIVACHTRHTNEKRQLAQCDICKKVLRKVSMYKHMHDLHILKALLHCPYCGESYKSDSGLHYHISQYHQELKTFKCEFCEFSTTQKTLLRRHLQRHNPEKTFICPTCGRVCYSLHSLKRHQIIHTNDKPWKCALCDNAYKRKEKLKQHMAKFHEKRTDYECPICPEEFYRNESLRLHVAKLHPEYELPPKGTTLHKAKDKKFVTKMWRKVEKVGVIANDPHNETWNLRKLDTIINKSEIIEIKLEKSYK